MAINIKFSCRQCKGTFYDKESLLGKRKFCSVVCSRLSVASSKKTGICKECGNTFKYIPTRSSKMVAIVNKHTYCSRGCVQKSNGVKGFLYSKEIVFKR